MTILVTGGAGYIGSHTVLRLLEENYKVVVVDNLCNSSMESIKRIEEITGRTIDFYQADLLNKDDLNSVFQKHDIDMVIHFAALKAVGESVAQPLKYYHNNITGTLNLIETMQAHRVKDIVFSSSATVYGDPDVVPITESCGLSVTNPYGRSKLMMEEILRDMAISDSDWNIGILRYFNPIGAHKSGKIGEDPNGIPNNLVPFITQVAVGRRDHLSVFGDDYDTPDGTGVRDYIHVIDLADGHIKAIEKLKEKPGVVTYNLGTGQGYSVMDMIKIFGEITGKPISYKVIERRPGDIASCYADPSLAEKELGWTAKYGLREMCEDSWRWQIENPNGFDQA